MWPWRGGAEMASGGTGDMTPKGARTVLIGKASGIERAAPALRGQCELVGAIVLDRECDVIAGAPVLGALEALTSALTLVKAQRLVWAELPVARSVARSALASAARASCAVFVYDHQASGPLLRPLALDDLLGAPQIDSHAARLSRAFAGKRVLVTGGGGSIGAELMRRLAALGPARLVALDCSELNLFNLAHEPALAATDAGFIYADVRDRADIARIFARERPDIVFHAAAMKHVPIVEANPCQGVLTNVLGTRNVSVACAEIGAHLVFVSTDKAVQPKSVMGATKRLAGIYCRALDRASARRSIVVRLGNVLGSTGSAAPLFERQLKRGGPITVTDPEAARFFVTVAQAADFLLQTAAVSVGPAAPDGTAFVLDMGEEIPIVELARDIVRLSGRRPGHDVDIRFVGLRPGEKLREALVADDETILPTEAPAIRAIEAPLPPLSTIERWMEEIITLARNGENDAVKQALHAAVSQARLPAAREAV